ncbi:ATP synthase F0 subcomplex subunit H atp14 [Yamadazyma tenuis]|uniref:Uncharacterized protein n=1 Tax=Candida tenuis (strain ATCC 10573 / BCRC 21748 / CBS 615 / JCM 9827 / NBRC 10315 / NRRL Y-1498 / VKM Y-70) TaxID=590646 RepID=G3B2B2_CANTC|nr:uncharacterized protein CANTEDRAFT_113415 [Yamadazyma tenuis ATCC 10573]EGV64636.1 hypothetical protein CANTEDRAFT_113415 [Yamadazyma tenuis ATCC 10573]WEJ97418.1 ATP synthase F0 subcomplex subunit H atp14 [Yamadazyma tenuis]
MFRQVISRRFSITPRRSNLVSDLYISNIKAFKPTPSSAKDIDSAVKAFQLPAKPTLPSEEISSDLLKDYEASEVETVVAAPAGAEPVEEDWFVFEEVAEGHH